MLIGGFFDEVLRKSRVFERFKYFKEGRESVEDDQRFGRPSTGINLEILERIREIRVPSDENVLAF